MLPLDRGWSRILRAVRLTRLDAADRPDFESLEDLRLHSAAPPEMSNSASFSRSGRQRIPPVDWTQDGRFDLSTFAEAFATFRRLRTLEINHATLPHLIPLTKSMISHAHPGSTTTGPDLIADQMRASASGGIQADTVQSPSCASSRSNAADCADAASRSHLPVTSST